jgi:hypothetical protein
LTWITPSGREYTVTPDPYPQTNIATDD